jgi:hypothetical protein
MKNILYIFILAVLLSSCKVTEITYLSKKEIISGVDFRKYTEKGFLITPEKYSGDYESIGIIDYLIMPEAKLEKKEIENSSANQWQDQGSIRNWKVDEVNIQNALEGIYNQCIKMGADALVNFKAEIENEDYSYTVPPVTLKGFRVTGFAIKRK